jgi:hypothetical protein
MELLISIIVGLLVMEVYSWLPSLCDKLVEQAVRRVRPKDQDRCREEWSAGLVELPNTLYRLVHAVSIAVEASRLREDSFEFDRLNFSAQLQDIAQQHAEAFRVLADHKADLESLTFEQFDELVGEVKSVAEIGATKGLDFGKLVAVTEAHRRNSVSAYRKAVELRLTDLEHCLGRLSEMSELIDRMTANLNALNVKGKSLTISERDALLIRVDRDLLNAKTMFADSCWGDDETFAEANRLFSEVEKSVRDYSELIGKVVAALTKKNQ